MNQLTLPILPTDAVLHRIDGVEIWTWVEVQDCRDQLGSYRAPTRLAGAWIPCGFTILSCGDTQAEFLDPLIQQAKKAYDEIWKQHHNEPGAMV